MFVKLEVIFYFTDLNVEWLNYWLMKYNIICQEGKNIQ